LLYNGDLHTIEDIQTVTERFPRLAGLVIGRGLLANPALAWEYQQNRKLSPDEMLSKVKQLHTAIYNSYEEQLQGGETQLLMKMKNFWEYLLPNGNRKAKKTIHKTSKLTNYRIAVNDLLSSYQYVLYDKGLYREQLYDMVNDRGEMRNLAIEKKYRQILLQHRAYLNEWMKLHHVVQIRPEVHLIPDM
jgi:hypothetical protein